MRISFPLQQTGPSEQHGTRAKRRASRAGRGASAPAPGNEDAPGHTLGQKPAEPAPLFVQLFIQIQQR